MKKFLYFIVAFMLILQTGFLSGIPAHAEGDVTETPTPEPTQHTGTNGDRNRHSHAGTNRHAHAE